MPNCSWSRLGSDDTALSSCLCASCPPCAPDLFPLDLLPFAWHHLLWGKGDQTGGEETRPGAWQTYPQLVGQGDHLGCHGFGVLLPDGIQDDVSQEAVTFLCIKHLFPGQRETQESHFCGGESGYGHTCLRLRP